MNIFKTLVWLLLPLSLCGCEDEEAPLLFDTIENTSPDVTSVQYYAPSAYGNGEKEYYVVTDFSESGLKLECSNCDNIEISCELRKFYSPESGGTTTTAATAEETGIYVSLTDGNIIAIRFAEPGAVNGAGSYFGTIYARDKAGGGDRRTIINIARHLQE
ncbi:MAG: hypothetical protein J6B13_09540 [Muribaculaceae bacterium]|nr:hypothetical protein [Muribaculaceae bacterium]